MHVLFFTWVLTYVINFNAYCKTSTEMKKPPIWPDRLSEQIIWKYFENQKDIRAHLSLNLNLHTKIFAGLP